MHQRLPQFLIIGAQKAGTTWLMHMLRQHTSIFMPPTEVHFFNIRDNYDRGLGWYSRHFRGAGPDQIVGEKTPNYLWVNAPAGGPHPPNTHKRIAEVLPSARLVTLLRDPVERAVSAYNHHLSRGRLPPHAPMEEVLFGRHRDLAEGLGILTMGYYYTQIQAYLRYFDREQLLVLLFEEDVIEQPMRGLRRVCEFLGVDPDVEFEEMRTPKNRVRPTTAQIWANYLLPRRLAKKVRPLTSLMPERDKDRGTAGCRRRLADQYREEVEGLSELLNRDIDCWGLSSDQV